MTRLFNTYLLIIAPIVQRLFSFSLLKTDKISRFLYSAHVYVINVFDVQTQKFVSFLTFG